jgi:hypothetical protein
MPTTSVSKFIAFYNKPMINEFPSISTDNEIGTIERFKIRYIAACNQVQFAEVSMLSPGNQAMKK